MNEEKKDDITIDDIDHLYGEDIEFWNKELEDTEALYKEMKQQYDNVRKKNSGTSGSFTFMMTQAENLIKLKETKMKIAKERVNTKKIATDTKLSIIRNTKTVEGEEAYEAIAKAMYKQIMEGPSIQQSVTAINNENEIINAEEVDDLLEARLAEMEAKKEAELKAKEEEQSKFEKNRKELEEVSEIKESPEVYKYITNMNKEVIAVDENYNEILGVEIPEEYKDIVIYMNDNDELVAASNVTGEVIEIAEF